MKTKAVEGALKILYWPDKNEVAHFTQFESLNQLCIDLGPKRTQCIVIAFRRESIKLTTGSSRQQHGHRVHVSNCHLPQILTLG